MTFPSTRGQLVDVASGRQVPSLVIRDVHVANVLSREIHPATIVVHGDRIAAVLDPSIEVPVAERELDGHGRFALPGFIDPHLHTESSAVCLSEFARAVVPRGVTTIICDPHEFGNVLGRKGLELLLEEAAHVPLTVKLRVPPRVPEMPADLESSGGTLTLDDTLTLLDRPDAACLAGDINPQFFLRNDPSHRKLIDETIARGKTVSGYSPGLTGRDLNAYVAAGAEDSHTPYNVDELREDIRAGLHVFLTPRPGRFDRMQFRALAETINSGQIDSRRICLCTDDIPPDLLITRGHLDHRLRLAIEEGIPPLVALQMATINPATEMRIERDHGSISAGKYADIVLVDDIEKISVDSVLYHGELVVTGGRYIRRPSSFRFPGWAKQTIQVTAPVDASTLLLHVNTARPHVECKAIVQQEIKRLRRVTLPVIDGAVQCDPDQDVVHVAVLDRYNRSGRVGHGFAYGTGIKAGAVASTINHNAHNLFALGRNANDMAIALDRLIAIGGGYVLVKDSVVISELALPVIGMISEQPLEDVAQGFRDAEAAVASLGCTYDEQPLLRLSFFCAPVIRHVGLTDFGLINTDTFQREDVTLDA